MDATGDDGLLGLPNAVLTSIVTRVHAKDQSFRPWHVCRALGLLMRDWGAAEAVAYHRAAGRCPADILMSAARGGRADMVQHVLALPGMTDPVERARHLLRAYLAAAANGHEGVCALPALSTAVASEDAFAPPTVMPVPAVEAEDDVWDPDALMDEDDEDDGFMAVDDDFIPDEDAVQEEAVDEEARAAQAVEAAASQRAFRQQVWDVLLAVSGWHATCVGPSDAPTHERDDMTHVTALRLLQPVCKRLVDTVTAVASRDLLRGPMIVRAFKHYPFSTSRPTVLACFMRPALFCAAKTGHVRACNWLRKHYGDKGDDDDGSGGRESDVDDDGSRQDGRDHWEHWAVGCTEEEVVSPVQHQCWSRTRGERFSDEDVSVALALAAGSGAVATTRWCLIWLREMCTDARARQEHTYRALMCALHHHQQDTMTAILEDEPRLRLQLACSPRAMCCALWWALLPGSSARILPAHLQPLSPAQMDEDVDDMVSEWELSTSHVLRPPAAVAPPVESAAADSRVGAEEEGVRTDHPSERPLAQALVKRAMGTREAALDYDHLVAATTHVSSQRLQNCLFGGAEKVARDAAAARVSSFVAACILANRDGKPLPRSAKTDAMLLDVLTEADALATLQCVSYASVDGGAGEGAAAVLLALARFRVKGWGRASAALSEVARLPAPAGLRCYHDGRHQQAHYRQYDSHQEVACPAAPKRGRATKRCRSASPLLPPVPVDDEPRMQPSFTTLSRARQQQQHAAGEPQPPPPPPHAVSALRQCCRLTMWRKPDGRANDDRWSECKLMLQALLRAYAYAPTTLDEVLLIAGRKLNHVAAQVLCVRGPTVGGLTAALTAAAEADTQVAATVANLTATCECLGARLAADDGDPPEAAALSLLSGNNKAHAFVKLLELWQASWTPEFLSTLRAKEEERGTKRVRKTVLQAICLAETARQREQEEAAARAARRGRRSRRSGDGVSPRSPPSCRKSSSFARA